jgi:hypothetical protein
MHCEAKKQAKDFQEANEQLFAVFAKANLDQWVDPMEPIEEDERSHSSETPDMVIMIGEAKLCNEMLTYQNITATIRKNRNYPFPPAWTKGERHAQNEQNWLSKKSYRQWGYSARFLDFVTDGSLGYCLPGSNYIDSGLKTAQYVRCAARTHKQ